MTSQMTSQITSQMTSQITSHMTSQMTSHMTSQMTAHMTSQMTSQILSDGKHGCLYYLFILKMILYLFLIYTSMFINWNMFIV